MAIPRMYQDLRAKHSHAMPAEQLPMYACVCAFKLRHVNRYTLLGGVADEQCYPDLRQSWCCFVVSTAQSHCFCLFRWPGRAATWTATSAACCASCRSPALTPPSRSASTAAAWVRAVALGF